MASTGPDVVQVEASTLRPAPTPELLQNLAMVLSLAKLLPAVLGLALLLLAAVSGGGEDGPLFSYPGWFMLLGVLLGLMAAATAQFVAAKRTDPVLLFAWGIILLSIDVILFGAALYNGKLIPILISAPLTAIQLWVTGWAFRAKGNLVDPANPPKVAPARLW